jgi:flagellar biosynthesis component FlhA
VVLPLTKDATPITPTVTRAFDQQWAWLPLADVNLSDKPNILSGAEFLNQFLQRVLLQNANALLTRNNVLKMMAIVQQQAPGLFEDLFEQQQLTVHAFKQALVSRLRQGQSIRHVTYLCEQLLT